MSSAKISSAKMFGAKMSSAKMSSAKFSPVLSCPGPILLSIVLALSREQQRFFFAVQFLFYLFCIASQLLLRDKLSVPSCQGPRRRGQDVGAKLSGAKLSGAKLSGAKLSGPSCPGPRCPGPRCQGQIVHDSTLLNTKISLQRVGERCVI